MAGPTKMNRFKITKMAGGMEILDAVTVDEAVAAFRAKTGFAGSVQVKNGRSTWRASTMTKAGKVIDLISGPAHLRRVAS